MVVLSNYFVQIGVGMIPLMVLLMIVTAFRKRNRLRNGICLAVLFLGAGLLILPQLFNILKENTTNAELATYQESELQADLNELNLLYAIAGSGSQVLAQELLRDIRVDYEPKHSLVAARLFASSGDYVMARALYLKALAYDFDVEGEYQALLNAIQKEREFFNVTSNLEAGEVFSTFYERGEEINRVVGSAIRADMGEAEDNTYRRIANIIVFAKESYEAFLSAGFDYDTFQWDNLPFRGDGEDRELDEFNNADFFVGDEVHRDDREEMTPGDGFNRVDFVDVEEVRGHLRRLDTILTEHPEFLEIEQVRFARLKLQVLAGDFSGIAGDINAYSGRDELLIVSELYINNVVRSRDFTEEFTGGDINVQRTVYQHLRVIFDEHNESLPQDEREEIFNMLEGLSYLMSNPILGRITERLLELVADEGAIERAQVYLQLAKIEYHLGNISRVTGYINRAFETVGMSTDEAFVVPMYNLKGIIHVDDSPERLRNIATYVEQVLDNQMPVVLTSNVLAQGRMPLQEEGDSLSLTEEFGSYMQSYVNERRISVNIVGVNTTYFARDNTVIATVNINDALYESLEELKEIISIQDVGIDITDFEIEKVDFQRAYIVLLVDVSGSMRGQKIEDLRTAIRLFAEDISDIERISLVTFDSRIVQEYDFGMTREDLLNAADDIAALGGTAIYHSILHSIERFQRRDGVINTIIVMSDGLDGYRATIEQIEENIGLASRERGITVYTIGFGNDVDPNYLNAIAVSTGGRYLFADEPTRGGSDQLGEFFNLLRAQMLNQYRITFRAVDTLNLTRTLEITVGDGMDRDRVTYFLTGCENSLGTPDDTYSVVFAEGQAVFGFEPRLLFRNGRELEATLRGQGFSREDSITVALVGNTSGLEWSTQVDFVDEFSLNVSIPPEVPVDTYDVRVTINGRVAMLPRGLSIFNQGDEKITDFGQYRFVSFGRHYDRNNHTITLSGHVTMNGWLHFRDNVTLVGDLNDSRITLIDGRGSEIRYSTQNSVGLAQTLARVGLPMSIPPLGIITLYNDTVQENARFDVRVEYFPLNFLDIGRYFGLSEISAAIYPNRVSFEARNFEANLPFADQILRKEKEDGFKLNVEIEGIFAYNSIGIRLDVEYKRSGVGQSGISPAHLGNFPIYITPSKVKVHIDTIANTFEFDFDIFFGFIGDDITLGLGMKWDNSNQGTYATSHRNAFVPSEVRVGADFAVTTYKFKVPITFSDFQIRIMNIDPLVSPLHWTFQGGCDISAAKISTIPGLRRLEFLLGDVSVLKMDNARITLNLGERFVGFDTNLQLFGGLDVGRVLIEAGRFSYTSTLLGLNSEMVTGLRYGGTLGPDLRSGRSRLRLQVEGMFNIHSSFIGLEGRGDFEIFLSAAGIFSVDFSRQGEVAVGLRITSNGDIAFVIRTNPRIPVVGGITIPNNMSGQL